MELSTYCLKDFPKLTPLLTVVSNFGQSKTTGFVEEFPYMFETQSLCFKVVITRSNNMEI